MADKPKVNYYAPDDLEIIFSDNIGVVYGNDRFYLQFFQAEPPLEIAAGSERPVEKSKCIARVVVTPKTMAIMLKAMKEGLEAYKEVHSDIAKILTGEADG